MTDIFSRTCTIRSCDGRNQSETQGSNVNCPECGSDLLIQTIEESENDLLTIFKISPINSKERSIIYI